MPIRDVAAQNASLDNDYGTTRGPNAAASHDVALFIGDPMNDGVEVTGSGYGRVTVPATGWALADDGFKTLTVPVEFPPPSGAYPDSVTHWALWAGSVMWDCGPLTEPLDVTGASPSGPHVSVTVFYNDAVNEGI